MSRNTNNTTAAPLAEAPTDPVASTPRLIPVPRWNNYHDWPPPGGMRHLIFNQKTNGFASAFKRVGRRVLVDEPEFFRCVERQQARGAA